jgi:hypothetical protein
MFFSLNEFRISIVTGTYKLLNSKKKHILIYTDSRGHEITRLLNKHNPLSAYSKYFIKNYKVDCYTTPEKPTTFYDFIYFLKKNQNKYEHIICHVGVVDFAPRTTSQFQTLLKEKKSIIEDVFGPETYKNLEEFEGYETIYQGEKTTSFVPEFMISKIANQLNMIPNFIWISCNPILKNWNGNYKERPGNMEIVTSKSIELLSQLSNENNIDITKW